ncbi:MAG: PEP-CTERM sorting domain-containing protein [Planctomycetota bacterium]
MKISNLITSAIAVLFFAVVAPADVINYGDFEGDSVTYIDVTESSLESGALYGAPDIIGNQLDLPASGFASESNNGEVDFLDGRLSFMIEADPGSTISSITIEEFGAYFTFGEDSLASVSSIAFVETLEGGIFSGTFDFLAQGLASGLPDSGAWQQSLTITFPETTKITVTLDNQLFTFADDPGVSFIDKKGVDILVGKNVIPEPSTAILMGIGCIAFAARSRRR